MKRIVLSAFALLLVTAAVNAQSDTTKKEHRNHREMQGAGPYQRLNLSASQQTQLQAVRADFKKEADALKNQKLTEAERRASMQALREKQRSQMEAILTPEQKAQFDKMQKDRKEGMRDSKRGTMDGAARNRNGHALNLQKELALTTAQQEKIKIIRTNFKAKAETLRNDKTASAEQQKKALRQLAKAQQAQVNAVLTQEQQAKLERLRSERTSR